MFEPELSVLYKALKNRPNKGILYNTTAYLNYDKCVTSKKRFITKELLKNLKGKKQVHYMGNTIIGSFLYNARIIQINDDSIFIQPTGAKWKGKAIKFQLGEDAFISPGWI